MIVFKLENPMEPFMPPLIVRNISELEDIEATIGTFICLPGDEQDLKVGMHLTITAVEMSQEELDALPEWDY